MEDAEREYQHRRLNYLDTDEAMALWRHLHPVYVPQPEPGVLTCPKCSQQYLIATLPCPWCEGEKNESGK